MRDIVVTGIGAVTACGRDVEESWANVAAGKSAVKEVERFPTYELGPRCAASVPGYETADPDGGFAHAYGALALREALADGGLAVGDSEVLALANHGERSLPGTDDNGVVMPIEDLSTRLAAQAGVAHTVAIYGACAGGGLAIGTALRLLQHGRADVVIAGGADCLLRDYDFYAFCRLYAMSTRDCPPEEASCPFDARRDGFVLSEGAAFLVLETAEHAARRGADVRARLVGYGCSQNAYHIVASPPDAAGPAAAMASALRDASLRPEDVDYINAHGTSTRDNDWCETLAVHKVFGDHAPKLPVSSTKGTMGHPMAAAGAIEAVLSVKVLEEGVLPPTINLDEPDPACDLDYIPWQARSKQVRHVMTNSFGFGGHNSSLVFAAR